MRKKRKKYLKINKYIGHEKDIHIVLQVMKIFRVIRKFEERTHKSQTHTFTGLHTHTHTLSSLHGLNFLRAVGK